MSGMKLTFYRSSDVKRKPFSNDCNEGIEGVAELLRQVKERRHDVEVVDTSNLTDKERFQSYTRVTVPAIYKHYEVRRVFGTNRYSECWFGAEVPALLVTDVDSVGDTYPHRKGNRIATIHGFLTGLLAARAAQTN